MNVKRSRFADRLKLSIVFFVFILFSPWLTVLLVNQQFSSFSQNEGLSISEPHFIDKVNTLRGEMIDQGFSPFLGKILVNKYNMYVFELGFRFLESFDPDYLFFKGEVDINKSTQATGPIYLSFLPLVIYAIYEMLERKRKIFLYLLILLVILLPASFLTIHHETVTRIPFLLFLTYLASVGFLRLAKKRKFILVLISLLLIFEVVRFFHDYKNHYPRRLAEKRWQIAK